MIPAALRPYPDYLRLWVARVATVAAGQMMMVAVGWELYDLTGSAWDLGLVGLLQFLPSLLLMLVAGQVVDRFHRARIVSICVGSQGLVALLLMLGPLPGLSHRALLLLLSLVLGTIKAFQFPAQQALVPLLIPASVLPRAMAFGSAGFQTAIIAGPALGGLLYAAGASVVYACCALLFVLAGVVAWHVHHPAPAPMPRMNWNEMLAGVRFVRDQPTLLGAISLDLFAVLFGGATALLPMFAKDILQVGPWGLGLLRAAPAVGALLMSLALTRWPIERQSGPKLFVAIVVYGLATLAFGLTTSMALAALALAITGAADMVSIVVRQTMVQLETPEAMRGRVSAVNSVFIGASNQLGEFESGATAAVLGPVGSVVLGGVGSIVVAVLWWRWFPGLARRDALVKPSTPGWDL